MGDLSVCPADTDGQFVSTVFTQLPIPQKPWFGGGGDIFFFFFVDRPYLRKENKWEPQNLITMSYRRPLGR